MIYGAFVIHDLEIMWTPFVLDYSDRKMHMVILILLQIATDCMNVNLICPFSPF